MFVVKTEWDKNPFFDDRVKQIKPFDLKSDLQRIISESIFKEINFARSLYDFLVQVTFNPKKDDRPNFKENAAKQYISIEKIIALGDEYVAVDFVSVQIDPTGSFATQFHKKIASRIVKIAPRLVLRFINIRVNLIKINVVRPAQILFSLKI